MCVHVPVLQVVGPSSFLGSKVVHSETGQKAEFHSLVMSSRATLLAFAFGSVFRAVLREGSKAIFYLLQNSKRAILRIWRLSGRGYCSVFAGRRRAEVMGAVHGAGAPTAELCAASRKPSLSTQTGNYYGMCE